MPPLRCVISIFLALTILAGCGQSSSQPPAYEPQAFSPEEKIKVSTAIARARMSVDRFITAVMKPKPNQKNFMVRKSYDTQYGVEHIWLVDVKYNGTEFVGKIGKNPGHVYGVKSGDAARASRAELSDWMFEEGGTNIGGYILRLRILDEDQTPEFDEMQKRGFKD